MGCFCLWLTKYLLIFGISVSFRHYRSGLACQYSEFLGKAFHSKSLGTFSQRLDLRIWLSRFCNVQGSMRGGFSRGKLLLPGPPMISPREFALQIDLQTHWSLLHPDWTQRDWKIGAVIMFFSKMLPHLWRLRKFKHKWCLTFRHYRNLFLLEFYQGLRKALLKPSTKATNENAQYQPWIGPSKR